MAKSRSNKRRRPDGHAPTPNKSKAARIHDEESGGDVSEPELEEQAQSKSSATAASVAVAGKKPNMLTNKEFITALSTQQHDVIVNGMCREREVTDCVSS